MVEMPSIFGLEGHFWQHHIKKKGHLLNTLLGSANTHTQKKITLSQKKKNEKNKPFEENKKQMKITQINGILKYKYQTYHFMWNVI